MRKSYNWAMLLIVAVTLIFALTVANAAVDYISGLTLEGDKPAQPVDPYIVG